MTTQMVDSNQSFWIGENPLNNAARILIYIKSTLQGGGGGLAINRAKDISTLLQRHGRYQKRGSNSGRGCYMKIITCLVAKDDLPTSISLASSSSSCCRTELWAVSLVMLAGLPGYSTFNYMISAFLSLTTHQIIKMCEKGFVNQKQICNNELMKKINNNMHVYGALSNLSSLLRTVRDSSRIKAAIFTLHVRCDVN
ncbi:hypothetical protein LINPERHAP2_LOCUS30279 [Linum perenne]